MNYLISAYLMAAISAGETGGYLIIRQPWNVYSVLRVELTFVRDHIPQWWGAHLDTMQGVGEMLIAVA